MTAGAFDGLLTVATLDPGYDYDAGDYFATPGMVRILGGELGAATDVGAFIAWAGRVSTHYTVYGMLKRETRSGALRIPQTAVRRPVI